jgi:acetyl esterase/lipase
MQIMRSIVLPIGVFLMLLAVVSNACGQGRPPLPSPAHSDVRYGPYTQNTLDIWTPIAERPTPLVVYYHGGGFYTGDKRTLNPILLSMLLDAGYTVASVNYRLSGIAPFPAQMHDSARALQFLRHHASTYRIDPDRVGVAGISAGGGISMWLAFHDDLADNDSPDPVARQSTRVSVAVVHAAQSSYDPRFIGDIFDTDQVDEALIPFFGMHSSADVHDPKYHPLFEEASAINHLGPGDAPVLMSYRQENKPIPPGSGGDLHIHHPKFGFVLKERMDALNIECIIKLREDYPNVGHRDALNADYLAFFRKYLLQGQN